VTHRARSLPHLALLLALSAVGCNTSDDARVVTYREAELWVGRSDQPPGNDASWERVPLLDRWELERRRRGTEGWYRLPAQAPPPGAAWAVFVPRVQPNASIHLNGVELGRGGHMTPPYSRNYYRPLLFAIPASAWRPRENWLYLHFVSTPSAAGSLSSISVGPIEALMPRLETMRMRMTSAPQAAAFLALFFAAALLARPPPRRPADPWITAALLAFVAVTFSAFFPDARVPNRAVEWCVGCAMNGFFLLVAIATRREMNPSERSTPWWLAGYGLAALAFLLVPPLYAFSVFSAWLALSLVLGAETTVRLVLIARRRRTIASAVLAASAVGFALLFNLSDRRFMPQPWIDAFDLVMFPAAVIGPIGGYLVVTFVAALREARALNRTLDARIAEREGELRASERERALAEERNRLMRDVHDGTGGKLVSALALLRSGRAQTADLEETLADALDDLNLTIHSLRPGASDLPGLLGLLRARIERQTRQHGVALDWAISDAGEDAALSPERAMHVIRIVQEAVTNALRHAHGTRVRIASGGDGGATWFEIADDGRGGATPRDGGRGLMNLRQRAELLGGRLALHSDGGGTCVRVTLGA